MVLTNKFYKMDIKNIRLNKRSVDVTLSIELNEFTTQKEAINKLLEIAIEKGCSINILKQVFSEDGNLKIQNKHTFN